MQLPSCKKKIRPGGVYPLSSLFSASALTLSQTLFCEGYIEDVTLRKTKHLPLISMAWFLWSPSTGVVTVCSAVYTAIMVIWDFYQPVLPKNNWKHLHSKNSIRFAFLPTPRRGSGANPFPLHWKETWGLDRSRTSSWFHLPSRQRAMEGPHLPFPKCWRTKIWLFF